MTAFLPLHIAYKSVAIFGEDPENFLTRITGTLICRDVIREEEYEAGQITAFYLDLAGPLSSRYRAIDIFDLEQDATKHYEVLFDPETDEFREDLLAAHGPDIIGFNWLILNRLEIQPEFRGLNLGLAAIYRTIQQFGHGCAFISLEAAPLQVEARAGIPDKERWFAEMQMDSFTADISQATRRLKEYYSLLGFREVDKTNMMLLNPAFQQPTLDDIGFL